MVVSRGQGEPPGVSYHSGEFPDSGEVRPRLKGHGAILPHVAVPHGPKDLRLALCGGGKGLLLCLVVLCFLVPLPLNPLLKECMREHGFIIGTTKYKSLDLYNQP